MPSAHHPEIARYYHLLIGTYTRGKSEGIYVYRFDNKTGQLNHVYTAKGVENPSFLTVSPDGQFVYAVNELSGDKQGSVSAFKFNSQQGILTLLNQQASGGGDPCYLTLDDEQKFLVVANYSGGSFSILPIKSDGSLLPAVQTFQHVGNSVNPDRQENPHVHATVFSPDQKYLFVDDLGTDKVNIYRFDPKNKQKPLSPATPAYIDVKPGSGPRHLIFNKTGTYAYLILELSAEILVFQHNKGKLDLVQTVPITEADFEGEVGAAEIQLSPDGKFLYASNRGDANEIVVYTVDPEKGLLTFVERKKTMGKMPRHFTIDPHGNFLLVAHQESHSVVLFPRDKNTGKLGSGKQLLSIDSPVYLKMIEAR